MSAPTLSHTFPYAVSIVEDDEALREALALELDHWGFTVETFPEITAFYRYLATHSRSLAVLGIGPAVKDGLSVCAYLRARNPGMGIVFITERGLRSERLAGLEAGADACMARPIDVEELALILRRLGQRGAGTVLHEAAGRVEVEGTWTLEESPGILTAPNGVMIRLSLNEFQLLRLLLLEKPGESCSHAELAMALGELPQTFDKHRLEVIFSRVRERVFKLSGCPLPLQSVRGVGYVMLPN